MSFRNRCVILGANGPITLSVPLAGGRDQRALTKDIRIDKKESWQAHHWKSITSAYNKSPWLDNFRAELAELYGRRYDFLIDWNLDCVNWSKDKMAITTEVSLSTHYEKTYPGEEWIDWRNVLLPASIGQVDEQPRPYAQVFADRFGFVPHLSILDYLLCCGPVPRRKI